MLRDRALHDADADRWQMTLASDPVRGALQLADATREGAHPTESLGQKVEAIVNRPDVIDRLRDAFPSLPFFVLGFMRIRRVCDGAAVLDAAVNRPAELTDLGVRPAQLKALQELAAAVDALADLHVAEAVLGVVKGRTATAAAATTAAAGQAPPPDFDVVRTPRSGRTVNTVALVVLPNAPTPGGAQPSPAALADPAVAAYVDARAGAAASASWTWKKLDPDGASAGRRRSPTSAAFARATPSASASTSCASSSARRAAPPRSTQQDPPGPAIVRSLAAALAGAPALTEDVDAAPDTAGAAATELAQRYTRVRNAAAAAATDARTAAAPAATENARRRALVRMARWGITPLAEGSTLAERLVRAAEVLERRIAEAPATLEGATVEVIAGAIGALVSPEGPFPVFARLRAATFAGLRAEPTTRERSHDSTPTGWRRWQRCGRRSRGSRRSSSGSGSQPAASRCAPGRTAPATRGRPSRRRPPTSRSSAPPASPRCSGRRTCSRRSRPRTRQARWPSP